MSLTSQLRDKDSPVRQFFTEFENKDGAKNCLALLQSSTLIQPLQFTPSSTAVQAIIGTTTDYLIRYTANGNTLQFDNTIAAKALARADLIPVLASQAAVPHLENLLKIGKQNLNGIIASDYKAIYSATALTLMDNFYRSNMLPRLFLEPLKMEKKEIIKKSEGKSLKEKTTKYLFNEYFESLGGEFYANDISNLLQLFAKGIEDPKSELFLAKIVASNRTLENSVLVHGADFDCIIDSRNRFVLTDIKTTTKPLTIDHLRQIMSYALLYDEKHDDFKFSDIGIYHARSGSFRSMPMESMFKMSLPSFKSVATARKAFIAAIKNT